jgi:hypothetical protein
LRNIGLDEKIILKWVIKKYNVKMWIGFMWLSIAASERFLRIRH